MTPNKFLVEGLDRLGKSTLIKGLQNQLGYHQVLHFQKPEKLNKYEGDPLRYQRASFENLFHLLRTPFANIICDRAHLGEAVYSPLYRSYSGDYVFDLEKNFQLDQVPQLRLILLVEDFEIARHFNDDGESFDPTKRQEEQKIFVAAFEKSIIGDKRIVCVTNRKTGAFRSAESILEEVLQPHQN